MFPRSLPSHYSLQKIDGRFGAADNARFWCMVAVVAVHCTPVFTSGDIENTEAVSIVSTFFKFATIGFFLISGFLLEKQIQGLGSLVILRKRMRKVFLPWLFWCGLLAATFTINDLLRHRTPFLPGVTVASALLAEVSKSISTTAFWFVPNILFALGVLLLFRRYLRSLYFGSALFAANLFYVANIYGEWITPNHPRALFAYIFPLWLGVYAAAHRNGFNRLLSRIPALTLAALTALSGVASYGESRLLLHLHSADPLNTLRLSNQIFTVLVILCLCKFRGRIYPRFVDVPRHTFGIYLSHPLVASAVIGIIRRFLGLHVLSHVANRLALRIALWFVATFIIWTAGFLISRFIAARPSLCWLLGLTSAKSKTLRETTSADLLSLHPR